MKRLTKGVAAGALMSKTTTVLVTVLVAILAAGVTGVASYAIGQGSRMSDEQVRVKVHAAVDRAERQAELHTARMLDDQADEHAKDLKRARKVARARGYRIGKNEAERSAVAASVSTESSQVPTDPNGPGYHDTDPLGESHPSPLGEDFQRFYDPNNGAAIDCENGIPENDCIPAGE